MLGRAPMLIGSLLHAHAPATADLQTEMAACIWARLPCRANSSPHTKVQPVVAGLVHFCAGQGLLDGCAIPKWERCERLPESQC